MKEFKSFYKTVGGAEGEKCNYPTRLDTYGCGCQHDCNYCYAKSLLSFRDLWNNKKPSVADIKKIERKIKNLPVGLPAIRLGGMTDCFQPLEKTHKVTYNTIKALNKKRQEYLIVTKSSMVADDEYIEILDKDLAHIQITITTTDDKLSATYEKASKPSERIKAVEKLQELGFDVQIRLSPFIPEYIDYEIFNSIKCDKLVVEFLRVNSWIKKWFDIDYSEYTLKQNNYYHLPLKKKLEHIKRLDFKEITVCEDEDEAYDYWKNNFNPNKADCCNLRKKTHNKMNVIEIKLSDIKPYENNPRNNDEAVESVANSIKEFGFKQPIVLDRDNVIVIGHTRYKASILLGLEVVPCIFADDLSEDQIKALRLADNKTGEIATWDFEKLDLEIDSIDLDLEPFGFEFEDEPVEIIEDEVPDLPEEPTSKLGEVYQLGEHRLMCGDSRKVEDINKLLDNKNIKLLFTSPPYNMNGDMYENYNDNMKSQEFIDFNLDVAKLWIKNLKGYLFWNISYNKNSRWEFIEIIYRLVKETGLKFLELILWNKKQALPVVSKDMLTRKYEDILVLANDENVSEDLELYYLGTTDKKAYFNKKKAQAFTNLWEVDNNNCQLKNNKACFPVNLPAKAISLVTDVHEIVADCFGGSGSTLIACEQLNRKCYMMELDPRYVDVIIKRWENFTGKKAIKL